MTLAEMLAEIHDWSTTLPSRCPTILRVGPGVQDELRRIAEPATNGIGRLPLGVSVVEDPGYPIGVWRILDQWGEEISAGVIPLPGATVKLVLDDGGSKDMRVLTVTRDERGRITEYTAADTDLLDEMPYATRWFDEPV